MRMCVCVREKTLILGKFVYFVVLCDSVRGCGLRFLPLFRRFKRIKLKSGVIVHRKDFKRL